MNDFEIMIASPYDREYLVAEIWYNNDLIAEVNQEKGFLEIEFYFGNRSSMQFPFDKFQDTLCKAKKKILGDI